MSDKIKVAVLGGGAGALSAALALTADPARRDRYEVTVYTLGWRLGGKGASGRNPKFGQRIEEHGIHVWFGFYDNAFRLLDGCYRELVEAQEEWKTPEGRPVSLDRCVGEAPNDGAAFHPHEHFVVNEAPRRPDAKWSMWPLRVPRNEHAPGDGKPVVPEASLAFVKLVEMLESMTDIRADRARDGREALPLPSPEPLAETPEEVVFRRYVEGRVRGIQEGSAQLTPEDLLRQALDGLAAPDLDDALVGPEEGLLSPEAKFRTRLRFVAWALKGARLLIKPWAALSEKAHRLYLACDTFAAFAIGISKDVFGRAGDPEQNLDALDELDLREWLGKHGADPTYLLSNPTVRFIYNSAFAFVDGKHQQPSIAAGSALRGALRLFLTYKGAFAYRMAAGMGDVVFSPIYEVLRRRGVTFKFFHRIDGLGVADVHDGRPVIDEIRVTEQVPLAGATYDPFVWVNDFPCWPSDPHFEQLANGAALKAAVQEGGPNLEDPRGTFPDERQRTLRRGTDFDEIVLGIPVEALKPIAGELCAHPKLGPAWRAMLAKTATTPTQGFQIWSRASLKDLGWDDPEPVFGTYVEPIDTYIDMTPALALEERRADDIKSLAYFCGVFDRREGETHAQAMQRSVDNAIEHLVERCSYIWPRFGEGRDFQWKLLWGAQKGGSPRAMFQAGQFARANVLPSELYTLNLPGTRRYRLRPDAAADPEGGVPANLWLAGDWTMNPINLGCVEATVMSGLAAARGLSGDGIEIVGERDDYLWQSFGRGKRALQGLESVAAAPALDGAAPKTALDDVDLAELKAAVESFDRPAVEKLCAALIQRLDGDGAPVSEALAKKVLSALRKKRHFDLMAQVADALIQAGVDAPQIRRQFAQALIDQEHLSAALAVLKDIAAESKSHEDLDEQAEVLGLIGRIHKQRYVNAPNAPRAREWLSAAVKSYNDGYALGRSNSGWHAVNAVALIQRARIERVPLDGRFDAPADQKLARAALEQVGAKLKKDLDAWDYAIEAEASLALGDHKQALASLTQYVARPEADAFEVNSTLRQLKELWRLTADTEPGAAIVSLLDGELLARSGGQLELSAGHVQSTLSSLRRLGQQKVFGKEMPATVEWLGIGLKRCSLVARIKDEADMRGGTGFLVRAGDFFPRCGFPDELVLLTNAHVVEPYPTDPGTLSPQEAIVRFEAVEDQPRHRIREIMWTSPLGDRPSDLDATFARLDPAPVPTSTGFHTCPIAPAAAAPEKGARVYVIGHPERGPLSISLYDNLLIDRDDKFVHYRAPTRPGNSGGPVFDRGWNLIALHHAGHEAMPRLNGHPGRYPANEGIWIEAIRRKLAPSAPP